MNRDEVLNVLRAHKPILSQQGVRERHFYVID